MPTIMLVLPIMVREMQVAARRRRTYWVRLLTAVLALLVTLIILLFMRHEDANDRGTAIFVALGYLSWGLAIISGLWLTSDSLSAEKREGTLGLLFLTDLRSHDIVLGKLAAHLLQSLGSLLALIPILCVPLLLGGRTIEEIGRLALALWAALFFSLSLGLAVSACVVRMRHTGIITNALLAWFAFLSPWLGSALCEAYPDTGLASWAEWLLVRPSPLEGIGHAFDHLYDKTDPALYWWPIGSSHALALGALVLTWWRLPRSWQNVQGGFRKGSWREWWHRFWTGSAEWRQAFRQHALQINPAYWLASRDRWGPWLVWFPVVIAAQWWISIVSDLWVPKASTSEGVFSNLFEFLDDLDRFFIACVLGFLYKLWFAWRAALFLGEARREQTLEFLLTAPVHQEQILWGQWQALWRMFRGPFAFMVLLLLVFGIDFLHRHHTWKEVTSATQILWSEIDKTPPCLFFLYYYGVVSLFDLAALGWLSFWLSLRWAMPHRAALCTFALVIALPLLVWLLFYQGLMSLEKTPVLSMLNNSNLSFSWLGLASAGAYLAIHIGMDLLWIYYARWRLRRYFRLVAATPVGLKPRYQEG
ncbi:MAG: ABC transporter permease [Verrucomicrobiae bacterium]|nr:ABC transporter permease [Verrucomicrobiae bacterium]